MTEFCERLIICIEQAVTEVAAMDNNDRNQPLLIDCPIARHIKALGMKIEKILIECISLYLKFDGKEDQKKFFLNILLGKFVHGLQKLILTDKLRQRFVTLDEVVTLEDGRHLDYEQRQTTEQFLSLVFDNIRITVRMSVADLLKMGDSVNQDTIFKIKISGPTMQNISTASSGVRKIPSGSGNLVVDVCKLLLKSAKYGPEEQRRLESRLLRSTVLGIYIDKNNLPFISK